MSSVQDVVTSLIINSATSVAFIGAFAFMKNQPVNARVYFAKGFMRGQSVGPQPSANKGRSLGRYINLDGRTYLHIMDWIKSSLRMPEAELIAISGLDSAVFLRIILLGIKVFLPMMFYGFVVLVPLNVTDDELANHSSATHNSLDKITIANIQDQSNRLWAHLIAAYLYTGWTCWLLFQEYLSIVDMRFSFIEAQERRPDQFTILCRCIPKDPDEEVKEHVDHFFRVNHPDHYLLTTVVYNANRLSKLVKKKAKLQNKVTYLEGILLRSTPPTRPRMKNGFLGLWGESVDKLEFYTDKVEKLSVEIRAERIKVLQDEHRVMPAAFVSFENRWAAAVCSQTKQSKDSTKWLTEWAPEPRDVYWTNLPIPYLQLNSRRLAALVVLFFIIFFFLIPVSFVQSLANLDKLEKNIPFLKPLIESGLVKSILQGFLPGLILKIFMLIIPFILLWISIFEGYVSYSKIEKHAAIKYLVFMLVNTFIGNVITGTTFEQLRNFIETPTEIPNTLGLYIPLRASFFITYIMVDGWTNCASELLRILPLIMYHIRIATIVRTQRDKERATPVDKIVYVTALPRLGLYFLLGLVYSVVSPLIIPFILIYLAAAYVVYRNQIINVYEQKYESAGGYWPVMFAYVIVGLLVMHATLIGIMTLKKAASSTPFLLPLPICTILFWYYCRTRFGEGFHCYALEEAVKKDTIERAVEPKLDTRDFLETAYMHPVLRSSLIEGEIAESDSEDAVDELLHKHAVQAQGPSSRLGEDRQSSLGSSTRSSTRRKLLPDLERAPSAQESTAETDLESPRQSSGRRT